MAHILVVDDDANICEVIRLYLAKERFRVDFAHSGPEALDAYRAGQPDLVVLDLMLPGLSGWEVCQAIRQESQTPIIMLTAKGELTDRITGLELGADDYMSKPFDPNELVARIKAVLRRARPETLGGGAIRTAQNAAAGVVASTGAAGSGADAVDDVVELPGLIVNRAAFEVTAHGEAVTLTPKELELLFCLARRPGRVFTREQLLEQVWGYEYLGDSRTVDVHVNKIRSKCEREGGPWRIRTVWGVGYKLEIDAPAEARSS